MEKSVTVKNIIEFISLHLNCSQKAISYLIGVNEATLSSNLEKDFEELLTKKTGKRLLALTKVVQYLSEQGLSVSAMSEIIALPIKMDPSGIPDSIQSVIISEKYNLEPSMLIMLAQIAQREFTSRKQSRYQDELDLDHFYAIKTKTAI